MAHIDDERIYLEVFDSKEEVKKDFGTVESVSSVVRIFWLDESLSVTEQWKKIIDHCFQNYSDLFLVPTKEFKKFKALQKKRKNKRFSSYSSRSSSSSSHTYCTYCSWKVSRKIYIFPFKT